MSVFFCALYPVRAQLSTAPDPLPGRTHLEYIPDRQSYVFHGVGVDYTYSLNRGGSLIALTARSTSGGEGFFPSYYGGVSAELEGKVREQWTAEGIRDLGFRLKSVERTGDTLRVNWRIGFGRDSADYSYRFFLVGQTLVIDAEGGVDGSIAGIAFNQAFPYEGTRVIRVPYLTLLAVLYRSDSGCFVSLFSDWEHSNASSIEPWLDRLSTRTGFYSQRLAYSMLTSGSRNRLSERVYLSVAREIANVLPNIPGPSALRQKELWDRTILSYGRFFPWLLRAPRTEDPNPSYLDTLDRLGVRDLAILVKDWSNGQFDHRYPCTWPPDEYRVSACWSVPVARPGEGGAEGLRRLRDSVRAKGYSFALHENYVDYYATECDLASSLGRGEYRGLLPDGRPAKAFFFDCRDRPSQAWLLKPAKLETVALWSTGQIKSGLGGGRPVDWSYLDVSSSMNPSGPFSWDSTRSLVDFDAAVRGAGRFRSTLEAYRQLPSIVRSVYDVPVQGEGGSHFLYAGYYDGFEARLTTADDRFSGRNVPLLLEFALRKLHGKSAFHGVGHIQYFTGGSSLQPHQRVSDNEVDEYIATELAFGHGGLVTKAMLPDFDHSLAHAVKEHLYVLPVQRMYGLAIPQDISYYDADGAKSASQYIRDHAEKFDDVESPEFMGRVRVTYENGVVVFVNRTVGTWRIPFERRETGWCSYHLAGQDTAKLGTGACPPLPLNLQARCGWFVYLPDWPGGK